MGAVGLAAVVLFVFQYLLKAGVEAYDRGEQLEQRTRELASLQVGLIDSVMQTLSMRDAMAARHSAAVARYAREVARLLGLSERKQELVHTAGLSATSASSSSPTQSSSPAASSRRGVGGSEGASRTGLEARRAVEGYGPVADIVLGHHEKIDGTRLSVRAQRRADRARLPRPRRGRHQRS